MNGPQRINKYIAAQTGKSRRAVDNLIFNGQVKVNGQLATAGQQVSSEDTIALDGKPLRPVDTKIQTILLNKPVGYVTSRDGQGAQTIYDLLPPELHHLKAVGRLDKNSSGLLLLTNDGALAHQLTHPSFQKMKVYEVSLDRPLSEPDYEKVTKIGVNIGEESPSKFELFASRAPSYTSRRPVFDMHLWKATLKEGRNRQIRRTFDALGYGVTRLHRVSFGAYELKDLANGKYRSV